MHQRTASQPDHHVFRSGRLCYEAKATWERNNTAACVRVLALQGHRRQGLQARLPVRLAFLPRTAVNCQRNPTL